MESEEQENLNEFKQPGKQQEKAPQVVNVNELIDYIDQEVD
mgnify:CR=1 FL=1